MTPEKAYSRAEEKIEAAQRSGAKELYLHVEQRWNKTALSLNDESEFLGQLPQLQSRYIPVKQCVVGLQSETTGANDNR